MSQDRSTAERAAALLVDIERERDRYLLYARSNYATVRVLFWVSLAFSAAATVLGFSGLAGDPKIIATLAGLATLTSLISRQAGLQQRANWHYRKVDRLSAFSRELRYLATPEEAELAARIARLNALDLEMTREFETLGGEEPAPKE